MFYELHNVSTESYKLSLVKESLQDREYTCDVLINDKPYKYRFTMFSNTSLDGSFFIESGTWKSNVYNVDKVYDFVRISETSINYHDIYFLNKDNIIDIFIKGNRKSSLSTLNITKKGKNYLIDSTLLPITKMAFNHSKKSIMFLFVISGAIDKLKTTLTDAVSYTGKQLSLLAYTDENSHILGVVNSNQRKRTDSLQCLNSFFEQKYEFEETDNGSYEIREYVEGITKTFVKRQLDLKIEDGIILDNKTGNKYSYTLENAYIIFRKI